MRVILQRVSYASVKVDGELTGKIGVGLLVFVGFEESDTTEDYEWITNKIIRLRIFPDENNIMNVSVLDVKGEILIVSQFTLHASTKKGNRPSYIKSSPPEKAKIQYENFVKTIQSNYISPIQCGKFGADMKVELLNDGPVTIYIDSKNKD